MNAKGLYKKSLRLSTPSYDLGVLLGLDNISCLLRNRKNISGIRFSSELEDIPKVLKNLIQAFLFHNKNLLALTYTWYNIKRNVG